MLELAHRSPFTVHPGSTKMYHDVKKAYWWPGMKKDVAEFVSRCLVCQQVKVEHQSPGGLLVLLKVPQGSGRTSLWISLMVYLGLSGAMVLFG